MLTCPCNLHTLQPDFFKVNLWFTGVFALKPRLRVTSVVLIITNDLCFRAKIRKNTKNHGKDIFLQITVYYIDMCITVY